MAGNTLIITQHCAERYAERIMGREETDIAVYVAQHKGKIEEDINKMYEHATLIYTGILKEKKYVCVYLNGTWVLLTDKDNQKAITLYKIDLGLGEDFNKDFVNRAMGKIDASREAYCDVLKAVEDDKAEYVQLITESTNKAAEYRRLAKNLDKQIEAYNSIIGLMDDRTKEAEDEFKNSILTLIGRKDF